MKKLLLFFFFSCLLFEAVAAPTLTQSSWRWRNDNGSETSATWKGNENQEVTLNAADGIIRLRMKVLSTANPDNYDMATSIDNRISYATSISGPFIKIPPTAINGEHFVMAASAEVQSGTATTQQLTAEPGAPFRSGPFIDSTTPSGSLLFYDETNVREFEWVLKPTAAAVNGKYYFKLDDYISTPNTLPSLNYSTTSQPEPVAVYLNGLQFDGVNDYAEIPAQASNQFDSETEFTVSLWFKANSMAAAGLFNRPSGGGDMQFWLTAADGKFTYGIDKHGWGWTWIGTTDAYKVGEWVQVTTVRRNVNGQRKMEIYANGILVGSGTVNYTSSASNAPIRIGTYMNVDGGFANGQIDNVSLWKKALTVAEIKSLGITTLNGNEAGLAGYWRFDETTGTVAYDATANVNHGTLRNMDLAAGQGASTAGDIKTDEDVAYAGKLTGYDPSGKALTYSVVTAPSKGTLSITDAATGAFTYTPTADVNGTDVFTYKVNNGTDDSNTATVNVAIAAVNDAPVPAVAALPTVTGECAAMVTAPTANDDTDGTITGTTTDPLNYTVKGTYTVNWSYTDSEGATATQTQQVIVKDDLAPVVPAITSKTISIPAGQSANWNMYRYSFTDPLPAGAEITGITLKYAGRDQGWGGTGQWTRMVVSGTHIGGNQLFGYNQEFTINYEGGIPGYVYGGTNFMQMDFDTWSGWVAYFNGGTLTIHYKDPTLHAATLPAVTSECAITVTVPTAKDNCAGTVTGTSEDPLTYTKQGTYTINWSFDDGNGNISTSTQAVTVKDITKPTVLTKNITVQLDATGAATITPAMINNGSTDNCSIPADGYSLDKTSFTCADLGVKTVTLTVTDANGHVATGTATVTVEDKVLPVAKAKDITVQLDATGSATITTADVDNGSSDQCGAVTLTLSKTTFECANIGKNTVTLTVTDASGNKSTVDATVTIEDRITPVAKAKNITVQLDVTGKAIITADEINDTSTDNCSIASVKSSKTDFDCSNIGDNPVTLTITDASGNIHTAIATVTVEDKVAPVVSVKNITVQLDAAGNAIIITDDINNGSTDACGIASAVLSKTTFTCSDLGANEVTLTVTDNNSNVATAKAIVTVEDKIAPGAVAKNTTVQLDANGLATITESDVNNGSGDNCGIVTITLDKSSFTCDNVGSNEVTLTVTDKSGNKATATAIVTIEDNVAPAVITKNMTVALDASGKATITAADINNGSTDACGIASYALDKETFDCADIGDNEVTLTVTDNNGNAGSAKATVTITDNIKPTVLARDITVKLSATGTAFITEDQVDNGSTDACGIKSVKLSKKDFDCSNVGTNEVTLTITDNNGNIATAKAIVTVVDDVPPTATAKDITVQLDANGTVTITPDDVNNGSSDACGIRSVTLSKTDFDCSNLGEKEVILTVTDNNGNSATTTAIVTVEDNVAPAARAKDITVQLDANGATVVTPEMIDNGSADNCGIATIVLDKTGFTCHDTGANEVTMTVTDNSGNQTSVKAIVTVEDKVLPNVAAKGITVQLDADGKATITAGQLDDNSSDNCGIATITLSKYSFDCSNVGENDVTLTVTDKSGNTASAMVDVTIVDNINPTITAPADVIVDVDAGKNTASNVALGIPVTADNCSVASVTNNAPAEFPTGTTTVTWTVTDAAGNKAMATQTVTVRRDIVAVATPATVNVPIRTTFTNVSLPVKVTVTYSDGAMEEIGVTWKQGNFDGLVAGNYALTGELVLATGTTNTGSKTATITVVVEPNKVPTALAFSATTFAPNIKADEAIGTLTTTDPDDTEFVYTLAAGNGDKDNSLFEIIGDKVYLRTNNGLSGKTTFSFRVRSTDPYQNTIEKEFTLTKGNYGVAVDKLKIVNAFSPNGDGINDAWAIPELRFYNNVEIEVFDRSGVRLFHSTNPEMAWDGRSINGQILQGAFFYIVQVKDINLVKKGVVTILKK